MKIIVGNPPNIEELQKHFAVGEDAEVAFAYGDTIYNPRNTDLLPHMIFHEEVHYEQQQGDPEKWWRQYIDDVDFRIVQELEAYGRQVGFIRNEKGNRDALTAARFYAAQMAGPVYGNAISSSYAYKRIVAISEL